MAQTVRKPPKPRVVQTFEDGSKLRSDGMVYDPDTRKWRKPVKRRATRTRR